MYMYIYVCIYIYIYIFFFFHYLRGIGFSGYPELINEPHPLPNMSKATAEVDSDPSPLAFGRIRRAV